MKQSILDPTAEQPIFAPQPLRPQSTTLAKVIEAENRELILETERRGVTPFQLDHSTAEAELDDPLEAFRYPLRFEEYEDEPPACTRFLPDGRICHTPYPIAYLGSPSSFYFPTPTTSEDEAEFEAMVATKNKSIPMLDSLPEGWKGDSAENPNFKKLGTLSPAIMRKIEPAGPHFLAFARRKVKGRTFSEDDRIEALSKVKKVEDNDDGEISEEENPMMLAREAKDWKGQDHYAVLGLSKYRWRATDEQIKKAHRKKVLRHHPDKKAAQGQSENDQFFKCIQRAHEILSDPVKRRQFDSVDEEADEEPPTKKEMQKNFFKKWDVVFKSEARFSNKKPAPVIGNDNSAKEEVEDFYDFWYNFDSWRTFEYLDEDVPDDNEGRDHKRHVEKKNANARRKHKNEDIARLRKVVDDCLANDERIKRFRKEGNANKNKRKAEKEAAAKKDAEEKVKAKEAEEAKKKADEESAKVAKEQNKKAKEAAKNAVKKNKRTVKASVKDVNYFATGGEPSAKDVDSVLDDTELVMKNLDPDELAELCSKLMIAAKDSGKVKEVFTSEVGRLVGAGKVKEGDMKVFK